MANPAVVVDFIADTSKLAAGFRSAGGAAGGFGSRMRGVGKAALASAGAAGLGALVATIKTGVEEFSEASKVSAQTAATLKSTGGAAGITAKQVGKLAEALMKKSGVDDEAIQSGENLLLTFTQVQNKAGQGNDIFNQATKTMLDMSVALGQDTKASAIQLGKALNDPIKGVTALSKVGVSFTQAQRDQIKSLVDSGKTMEAQKIILAELNKEFGGSAEAAGKTLPGQINILKQSFSNLAGELIGQLVPAFTTILTIFTGVLSTLGRYKGVLPTIVIALAALAGIVLTVNAALAAYTAVQMVVRGATLAWAFAQGVLNTVMAANPIGIVIIAVAALVAAFVVAYKTSDTFRAIVDHAFKVILDVAKGLFNWIRGNWPLLLAILTGPIGTAAVLIARHWGDIRDTAGGAFAAVRETVAGAVSAVRTALSALGSWISGFAHGALNLALNAVEGAFNGIKGAAEGAVHAVQTAFNSLIAWIGGKLGDFKNAGDSIGNALKGPINAVIRGINSAKIPAVSIGFAGVKVGKKRIGKFNTTIGPFDPFGHINELAKGGVVSSPTLALVGEGQGREIVTPENLLRQIMGEQSVNVRVFIGDQELRGLVRTEITDSNTGLARTLLAGKAG